MATLKEIAASERLVSEVGLKQALTSLKGYIDEQDTTIKDSLQEQIDALVGGDGDVDTVINTFNEIKAFLADYTEDDTLKSLIDAVNTAINTEKTRAEQVEQAISDRVTTIEGIEVLTADETTEIFNEVFV